MNLQDEIIRELKSLKWGMPEVELAASIAAPKSEFQEALNDLVRRKIIQKVPPYVVHTTQFERRVQQIVKTAHEMMQDSNQAAVPVDRFWKATKCPWEGVGRKQLVDRLERSGVKYDRGRLFPANVRLKDRQRALLDRVVERLLQTPYNPPAFRELAQDLNIPLHAASDILAIGEKVGELTRVSTEFVVPTKSIEELPQILADKLVQPFAPSDATKALDSSRRIVIPLLEYLDAQGVTKRLGNRRVIVQAEPEAQTQSPDA